LFSAVAAGYPAAPRKRQVSETVRRMIDTVVTDLLQTTRENLAELQAADIDGIRAAGRPMLSFSARIQGLHTELKQYLHGRLYRHHRVLRMTRKARRVVTELFAVYMEDPRLMPPEHAAMSERYSEQSGVAGTVRAVTDYIAGMTDRFAISEHRRLFDPLESP
jgi:dGTPase